jgi:hypothetical protein
MFPASTKGAGMCTAFPDVCKVPAPPAPFVPTPFPNIAQLAQANGGTCSSKVKFDGKEAATVITEITMSSGDEAGTLGGMISGTFKGSAKYKKGSSRVKVEGNPVVYHTTMIGQNNSGNPNHPAGVQVAPSQTKVTVMP